MQAIQAKLVVDVKQPINYGQPLVNELNDIHGVSRVWVSPRAPRLVFVDYDPEMTNSQKILDAVTRNGFDGRIVGM